MNKEDLVYLFHHLHHRAGEHEVHHCGGRHKGVGYKILHCACGLRNISKQTAIGDTVDKELAKRRLRIKFAEKCPEGGWHIESGKLERRAVE